MFCALPPDGATGLREQLIDMNRIPPTLTTQDR
jgi:hypothetical protein